MWFDMIRFLPNPNHDFKINRSRIRIESWFQNKSNPNRIRIKNLKNTESESESNHDFKINRIRITNPDSKNGEKPNLWFGGRIIIWLVDHWLFLNKGIQPKQISLFVKPNPSATFRSIIWLCQKRHKKKLCSITWFALTRWYFKSNKCFSSFYPPKGDAKHIQ